MAITLMPLEDRIRQAINDGGPFVDAYETLEALGNIMAEAFAHLSEEAVQDCLRRLVTQRRVWMTQGQVLVQMTARGRA